jgi:hypothetical protein
VRAACAFGGITGLVAIGALALVALRPR